MTKFIFHGGGMNPNNSNDSFYKELVKKVPENGIVLLVYFASRSENDESRIYHDMQKCKEFALVNLEVLVATPEEFIHQVAVKEMGSGTI